MKGCFIHSAVSISPQLTFDADDLLFEILPKQEQKITAHHPDYKKMIAPAAARRMAPGVKMGVASASKALEIANLKLPEAIIVGSGMGCIADTEKFLDAIITNDEAFISPTAFIQSTHNTVGAQIALGLECRAYNNTFVHGSASFESALADAHLMIQQQEITTALVGGVDELGTQFIDYQLLIEAKESQPVRVPFGEGAHFFVMSSERNPHGFAKVLDVALFDTIATSEIEVEVRSFLASNQLSEENIDSVIFGTNGDGYDVYYELLANTLFSNLPQMSYKHVGGEYYTASGFGFWLAAKMLKHQQFPAAFLRKGTVKNTVNTILLYNQFKGKQHSIVLLRRC